MSSQMTPSKDDTALVQTAVSADQLSPEYRRKAAIGGIVGSFVQFYDYGIYGYVAVIMAPLFFPGDDPTAALLATFAVFAASFLANPIGGLLFGHFGDKIGRTKILAITILGMAIATTSIGLLPTYAAIGVAAPILLILVRLMQGLFAGGETGGAAVLLAEASKPESRGFFSALKQSGSTLGLMTATGLVGLLHVLLSPEQMSDWGWRLPFFLSLPTGLIGLYIRRRLEDSPAFTRIEQRAEVAHVPIKEVFRNHKLAILRTFGVSVVDFVGYYLVFVYLASYLVKYGPLSATQASWSTAGTIFLAACTLPFFGMLSDKIGRKKVIVGASLAFLVLTLPVFGWLGSDNVALAIVGQMVLGLCVAAIMGVIWAVLSEQFPTNVRYTGMSFGFNMAGALVGGMAPFIATWLIAKTANPIAPAWFIMFAAIVTLITAFTLKETRGKALED